MGLKQKKHEENVKFAPSFFLFQVNQPCKIRVVEMDTKCAHNRCEFHDHVCRTVPGFWHALTNHETMAYQILSE